MYQRVNIQKDIDVQKRDKFWGQAEVRMFCNMCMCIHQQYTGILNLMGKCENNEFTTVMASFH